MTVSTFYKRERMINRKLKRIDPGYRIRNLKKALDGKYIFDLKVAVHPKHFFAIRDVLKGVLAELPVEESVQAKFYLPKSLYAKVRKKAAAVHISQSAFVAQCLGKNL